MLHRALIVLVLLCTASGLLAEDYEIRLARPTTVGQRGREKGEVSLHQKTFFVAGGREVFAGERSLVVVFDLEWRVLELGKLGGLKKIETTVRRFVKVDQEQETELLAEGTRITSGIVKITKTHAADKGEIPPDAMMALHNIINFEVDGTATGDEVMGTKERKKVGDTWSYNLPVSAKTMAALGMKAAEADLTGEVKLASVGDRGGVRCMEIQASLKIKKMALPQDGLPAGMKALGGSGTVSAKMWLPLDQTAQEVAQEVNETMDFLYETPEGQVRTVTVVKKNWDAVPLK